VGKRKEGIVMIKVVEIKQRSGGNTAHYITGDFKVLAGDYV